MHWKARLAKTLRDCFEKARSESETSLRSFAKRVDVPVSTLSEAMRDKCTLTPARAAEIVERIPVAENEKNLLYALMGLPVKQTHTPLANADYEILADWRYLAILMSFDMDDTSRAPETLARRLDIEISDVRRILADLTERGLLAKAGEELVRTGKSWQTTDGPSRETIRRYHLENLKTAERALNRIPVSERDFTSFTFAGNLEHIDLIREEIRKMHERVNAIVQGTNPKNRLLQFSVSFFPVDQTATEVSND